MVQIALHLEAVAEGITSMVGGWNRHRRRYTCRRFIHKRSGHFGVACQGGNGRMEERPLAEESGLELHPAALHQKSQSSLSCRPVCVRESERERASFPGTTLGNPLQTPKASGKAKVVH